MLPDLASTDPTTGFAKVAAFYTEMTPFQRAQVRFDAIPAIAPSNAARDVTPPATTTPDTATAEPASSDTTTATPPPAPPPVPQPTAFTLGKILPMPVACAVTSALEALDPAGKAKQLVTLYKGIGAESWSKFCTELRATGRVSDATTTLMCAATQPDAEHTTPGLAAAITALSTQGTTSNAGVDPADVKAGKEQVEQKILGMADKLGLKDAMAPLIHVGGRLAEMFVRNGDSVETSSQRSIATLGFDPPKFTLASDPQNQRRGQDLDSAVRPRSGNQLDPSWSRDPASDTGPSVTASDAESGNTMNALWEHVRRESPDFAHRAEQGFVKIADNNSAIDFEAIEKLKFLLDSKTSVQPGADTEFGPNVKIGTSTLYNYTYGWLLKVLDSPRQDFEILLKSIDVDPDLTGRQRLALRQIILGIEDHGKDWIFDDGRDYLAEKIRALDVSRANSLDKDVPLISPRFRWRIRSSIDDSDRHPNLASYDEDAPTFLAENDDPEDAQLHLAQSKPPPTPGTPQRPKLTLKNQSSPPDADLPKSGDNLPPNSAAPKSLPLGYAPAPPNLRNATHADTIVPEGKLAPVLVPEAVQIGSRTFTRARSTGADASEFIHGDSKVNFVIKPGVLHDSTVLKNGFPLGFQNKDQFNKVIADFGNAALGAKLDIKEVTVIVRGSSINGAKYDAAKRAHVGKQFDPGSDIDIGLSSSEIFEAIKKVAPTYIQKNGKATIPLDADALKNLSPQVGPQMANALDRAQELLRRENITLKIFRDEIGIDGSYIKTVVTSKGSR